MARRRASLAVVANDVDATYSRALKKVHLQAVPDPSRRVPSARVLKDDLFKRPPDREKYNRRRFGRELTLDRIAAILNQANLGSMQGITDLSRETIDMDPHLAAILQKRFGAVSSLPWEVIPASGEGIDEDKAILYANVVRNQLVQLSNFSHSLTQLAWGLFDGRAALEICWQQLPAEIESTPRWVVNGLGWIHPRRIFFGPEREFRVSQFSGETSGFQAVGMALGDIPYKFVQFAPQLFADYQEREGLARRCLYWSFFKRFGQRDRMELLELFGKPWRIIEVDEESTADKDDLEDSDEIVDALGATSTARMPRGTKLNVVQPQRTAGQVHKEVVEATDLQLSKLVLGQTGTTDGVSGGFNSNTIATLKDEQLMIMNADARKLSEVLEDQLTDPIIIVNFGIAEVIHAPKFKIRTDLPTDRESELRRLSLALDAGLSVGVNDAHEATGWRRPDPNKEPVLRFDQPPTPALAPNPPAPRPVMVFPQGTSPEPGEQIPPADDDGGLVSPGLTPVPPTPSTPGAEPEPVREIAAVRLQDQEEGEGGIHIHFLDRPNSATLEDGVHRHLFLMPDGSVAVTELDGEHSHTILDGPLGNATDVSGEHTHRLMLSGGVALITGSSVSAHQHQLQTDESVFDGLHQHTLALSDGTMLTSMTPGEFVEEFPEVGAKKKRNEYLSVQATIRKVGSKWVVFSEDGTKNLGEFDTKEEAEERLRQIERFNAANLANTTLGYTDDVSAHVCAAKQPESVFGSPETFIDIGTADASIEVAKWVEVFLASIKGMAGPAEIMAAISRARASLKLRAFADIAEQHLLRSAMLGALDVGFELDANTDVAPAKFSKVSLADADTFPNWAKRPFEDAKTFFEAKEVVSAAEFTQLSAALKLRAFSIAGVTADNLLRVIRMELIRQLTAGTELREFSKFITQRVQLAGFVPKGAVPASYVETVFRTNVSQSLNAGRFKVMTKPAVLKLRPVWEIRTVRDGRRRKNHGRVHGIKLLATDPFWKRAYPPFGFNCRCRVVSRPAGTPHTTGENITAVPDKGFSSGIPRIS